MTEIINNLELERLTIDDIGFILIHFYSQYRTFEGRNEYHGDFDGNETNIILEFLKLTISNKALTSFKPYYDDYDILESSGFLDEMEWLDNEGIDYEMKKYNFQSYVLHLNHLKDRDKWKIGNYLFIRYENVGIELFQAEETEIRTIVDFDESRLEDLSIKISSSELNNYHRYLEKFKT